MGKSTLNEMLASETFTGLLRNSYAATVGASYLSRTWNTHPTSNDPVKKTKFGIWDTAGEERYNALLYMYCRDTKCILFCIDGTTFAEERIRKDTEKKLELLQRYDFGESPPKFILLSTKKDLRTDDDGMTTYTPATTMKEQLKDKHLILKDARCLDISVTEPGCFKQVWSEIFSVLEELIEQQPQLAAMPQRAEEEKQPACRVGCGSRANTRPGSGGCVVS